MPFVFRTMPRFGLSRPILAVACLSAAMLSATTAHAQEVPPGFAGQLQTTLPSNEQLLGQIQDTSSVEDLDVIFDQTDSTVGIGKHLVQQLTAVISMAPDDAARSRLEGVLTHTQAALDSLRMAQTESTLDAARGRLEQARGEAQESLNELRPFVFALIDTGAITGK